MNSQRRPKWFGSRLLTVLGTLAAITVLPAVAQIAGDERDESERSKLVGVSELDRAGINIAHNLLGGHVTASSIYDGPYYDEWALRNLNDGYITGGLDETATARILLSQGFTTNEDPPFPVEFIVSFNLERTATIQAFAIDARKSTFFDANNNRPSVMRVAYSIKGPEGPWTELPQNYLFGEFDGKRYYEFPEPLRAKFLKISVISSHAGRFVQLAEIEVYEIPESESYTSIVADLDRDIVKAGLGGGLVRFTSAANKELNGVGALVFDRLAGNRWQAVSSNLPQQFLFHFNGFKAASIDRIEVFAPPPSGGFGQASRIQVGTTMSGSPIDGYTTIGELTFSADRASAVLQLGEPVEARFVSLTIVESSGGPVTLGPVRIIEANGVGRPSVLEVGPAPSGVAVTQETTPPAEPEPNNSRESAIELELDLPRSGVLSSAEDVDYYQFVVPEDSSGVVNFELAGHPFIKTFLALLDVEGRELFNYDPSVAQATERFTWTLAPGRYWVRLHQPRTSIALVIDDSGSMRGALDDVRTAALQFVNGRAPDEDMAIVEFGNASHVLHGFEDDPSIMAGTIADLIGADENGTDLYDGVALGLSLLGGRQGNRALVLLSDGADFTSNLAYGDLWDALERSGVRLFIVALGDGMTVPTPWIGTTPRSMLEGWARATGGLLYFAPSSGDLAEVYGSVALTIRGPAGYSVSVSITDGEGTLQLVEVGEPVRGLAGPAGMMIILDASGSMRGDSVSGGTKMDAAKLVLRDLISSLPDELPVGVRAYGHRYPRDPAERSCEDTELIVPMAANNRDDIVRAVDGLQPQGQTPIGRSLRALESDLEAMGDDVGVVVVITDGIETCSPEPGDPDYPIDVVRGLQDLGLSFRVNVVGFDVDDGDTRAFLAALAERGDGDFFVATGANELRYALEESFRATYTVVDSSGDIIATSVVGASPLPLPVGRYRLVVEGPEPLVLSTDIVRDAHTRVELRKQGQLIGIEIGFGDLDELIVEDTPPLSPAALGEPQSVAEAQRLLAELGFDPGPADGLAGERTVGAILAFQEEYGMLPDGVVSEALLAALVEAASANDGAEPPRLALPPAAQPPPEPMVGPPLPPGNVVGDDVRVIDSALLSVDGTNVPLAGLIGLSDPIAVSIAEGILNQKAGFPLVCAPSQLLDLYGYFCLLRDGSELGLVILAAGGATATASAPARFVEAEAAARAAGVGIW